MATIAKQVIPNTGDQVDFVAAAALGDRFLNSGKEMLVVKKSTAGTATVTVAIVKTCNAAGADHDVTVTVAASDTTIIGPFRTDWFNDADGYVNFTYSSEANLTVGLISGS